MSTTPTGRPWGARTLFGISTAGAALAVVLGVVTPGGAATWIDVASAVLYTGVGLLGLLLSEEPIRGRRATPWVLLSAAAGASLLPITARLSGHLSGAGAAGLAVLDSAAAAALFGLFTLGVLIFPDGQGHGRLGRALVAPAGICLALLLVGGALVPVDRAGAPPLGWHLAELGRSLLLGGLALCLPITLLAAVTSTARRRAASGGMRSGLALMEAAAWVNAGAFLVCGALSVAIAVPEWFRVIGDNTGLAFAVAAWIAVVRFQLVDLRRVLVVTLPCLIVSAVVAGVAAVTAALTGNLVAGRLGATIGASVAAVAALLLRDQLTVLANLIVYHRRTDPATERSLRLEQALRDSHSLLVSARDDERRRIRRDLHDGLGPTLAGIMLGVENAERHLDDPERARRELGRLHEASSDAVAEVRRIVDALRPPTLDSLGLDGAIREQAGRLGAVSVEVADLRALPDTFEIGVYLIAVEAMRNAAVHARPGSFWVQLAAADRLTLEVHDDGPGLPLDYCPGVGITSMRERAADLGGTLDILPRRPRGTLVHAEWALPA